MRSRFVAVALVVIVALTLAGCGGSDTSTTTTDGAAGSAVVAPPPATGAAGGAVDTKSPTETVTNEPFPQTKNTPADVLANLQNKQAMMLFFYDPDQPETAEQRAVVDAVADKYRGLLTLLPYDISLGRKGEPTAKDPAVQKAEDMAGALKIGYTPYLVFVDRAGRVTYRFSGYTDQSLVEREALRATQ